MISWLTMLLFFGLGAAPPDIAGIWEGALAVGGAMSLRLVLHVAHNGSAIGATLDSPDQGAQGIPVASASFDGHALTLEMTALHAHYQGVLDADGAHVTGTFTQNGIALPLALHRVNGAPPAVARPQTPKPPFPYDAVDVVVPVDGTVRLAGTLTTPHGPGPFAAVVLLTGSGAQDRDETIFAHKPFFVLADHFTRQGIAVLRLDDRGVGKSTGDFKTATTYDFVKDAAAAVAFVKARPEIDAHRIGLLGHSEGAIVAPLLAAQTKDVAFVVLLGAPALTGEQIIQLQGARIAEAMGAKPADITAATAQRAELFAVVKAERDPAVAQQKLRAIFARTPAGSKLAMPDGDQSTNVQLMLSPWFRAFLTLDPRPALAKLRIPTLALIGEHDLQVPPKENLPELRKALAHDPKATIQEVAGVNHLFQTSKTGLPTQYSQIEETFAPAALKTITDWLVATTK